MNNVLGGAMSSRLFQRIREAFGKIIAALPRQAFGWLLAGGIIYTAGGVIYAMKLPIFNQKHRYFGSHEIFHLFVMGGSLCHYIMMYAFVA